MKLSINQIDIALDTYGAADKPVLILVHGLMSNRTAMQPLAETLSDEYYCVAYDCRGHGQSSKPVAFTLAEHAADLLALIEHFGGSAHVFGYSMGSYIAAQAAIRQPEKIKRLVLAVTKSHDDGSGSSIARLLKEQGLSPESVTETQTAQLLENALWHANTPPELRQAIMQAANQRAKAARMSILTAAQRQAISQALVGFDLRPELSRISCPTLVLAGAGDGINLPEWGRAVAEAISGSQFVVFEQSGHMLREEESDKLQHVLRTFFQAA